MAPSTFSIKLVKACFLAGIFVSLLSCGYSSIDQPVYWINSQGLAPTQPGNADPIEVAYAQLSADSGDAHNYAKHEDGLYHTHQIARGHSARNFKTWIEPLSIRITFLHLPMKLATMPSSLIAEQQRSIPVFLRRLLI